MASLDIARWNIYSVALQDLTLFTFSYLKVNFNYQNINQSKEIFFKILDSESSNKMPVDIIEEAKKTFNERLQNINSLGKTYRLMILKFTCLPCLGLLFQRKKLRI